MLNMLKFFFGGMSDSAKYFIVLFLWGFLSLFSGQINFVFDSIGVSLFGGEFVNSYCSVVDECVILKDVWDYYFSTSIAILISAVLLLDDKFLIKDGLFIAFFVLSFLVLSGLFMVFGLFSSSSEQSLSRIESLMMFGRPGIFLFGFIVWVNWLFFPLYLLLCVIKSFSRSWR